MSENKKDRKQYFKDYFDKNKDELSEKFICDICGGKYMKMSKANHIKTKKHQNQLLINKLKNDNDTMKNIIYDVNKKFEKI
jgi:hypothetical protein